MFIYIYKTYNLYNIYENMHIKASERSIYLTILVNNELFFPDKQQRLDQNILYCLVALTLFLLSFQKLKQE